MLSVIICGHNLQTSIHAFAIWRLHTQRGGLFSMSTSFIEIGQHHFFINGSSLFNFLETIRTAIPVSDLEVDKRISEVNQAHLRSSTVSWKPPSQLP